MSPAYVAGQQFVRARAYLAARRLDEAADAYATALDTYKKAGDTATTPTVLSERAEALVRLGRAREAQADLDVLLASRGPKLSPAVRRAVWLQGELWRRAGTWSRALPLLREAVEFEPTNVRNKVDRAQFQVSLGLALLDAGQLDEASRVLEDARAAFVANQGVMTPSHAEALDALARVHTAAGRRDAAQPLTAQVAAFWQEFDPDHGGRK